jgi:hypothetical protein
MQCRIAAMAVTDARLPVSAALFCVRNRRPPVHYYG